VGQVAAPRVPRPTDLITRVGDPIATGGGHVARAGCLGTGPTVPEALDGTRRTLILGLVVGRLGGGGSVDVGGPVPIRRGLVSVGRALVPVGCRLV
jgi:hypothetical protein